MCACITAVGSLLTFYKSVITGSGQRNPQQGMRDSDPLPLLPSAVFRGWHYLLKLYTPYLFLPRLYLDSINLRLIIR